MITSRIFTSETWLHALLHSALPLCWPSRTGKWFECVGLGKKKCQSNVNDDPIKKWFWFKLNNTNFSDFAIRSVSNFGSLFDFFFFFFFFCGSCGIFCNNFQFEGGWFFFFLSTDQKNLAPFSLLRMLGWVFWSLWLIDLRADVVWGVLISGVCPCCNVFVIFPHLFTLTSCHYRMVLLRPWLAVR